MVAGRRPKRGALRRFREQKPGTQHRDLLGARETATFIAMVVRNEIEDFHADNLTDDQMRRLNPLVRNAVYTALYALATIDELPATRAYVQFHRQMIPDYWEPPELTQEFQELLRKYPAM